MTTPDPAAAAAEAVEALKLVRARLLERGARVANYYICNHLKELAEVCEISYDVSIMLRSTIAARLHPCTTYGEWLCITHYEEWVKLQTPEDHVAARIQWLDALIEEFGGEE